MSAQSAVAEAPSVEFSRETFEALALTALSQFDRVPPSVHYYAVETLYRRMQMLTRPDIESELDYWRSALAKLVSMKLPYSSFDVLHVLESVRQPLHKVVRFGRECDDTTLKTAAHVCAALCGKGQPV